MTTPPTPTPTPAPTPITPTPTTTVLPPVPPMDKSVNLRLQTFCLKHSNNNNNNNNNRPIVLVSSGGTAADLELRTVRTLENFSTGKRGALSVEQFLERGYAVIHLQRIGSASPYGQCVAQALDRGGRTGGHQQQNQQQQGNHGLSAAAFNRLFENKDNTIEEEEEGYVETVTDDPWMTDNLPSTTASADIPTTNTTSSQSTTATTMNDNNDALSSSSLQLHHRLCHNHHLQRAWRQWRMHKSCLFTIPFRTVEEYLTRLSECSHILDDSKSFAMMYLAAAVSDFYVANKVEHKIQSTSFNTINRMMPSFNQINDNNHQTVSTTTPSSSSELILTLQPVPKVLGLLRTVWAPQAFCVSFKLETDPQLLRQKSEQAVINYGVHMVVGNLLETRHDTVHVLYNDDDDDDNNNNDKKATSVHDWKVQEISTPTTHGSSSSSTATTLESELIDFCIQQHFQYISQQQHNNNSTNPEASLAFRATTHDRLVQKQKDLQRQVFWKTLQDGALQWGGTLLGMGISYIISITIQRRILLQQQ